MGHVKFKRKKMKAGDSGATISQIFQQLAKQRSTNCTIMIVFCQRLVPIAFNRYNAMRLQVQPVMKRKLRSPLIDDKTNLSYNPLLIKSMNSHSDPRIPIIPSVLVFSNC